MTKEFNEINLRKEYYKNIEKTLINANIVKIRLNGSIESNKNTNQIEKINLIKLLVSCLDDVIASIQEIKKLSTDYHTNKEISGIKASYLPEDRSFDFTHIEGIFLYSNRINEDNQLDSIDQVELKKYKRLLSELLITLGVSQEMLREDVSKLIEQGKRMFNLDNKELNNMLQICANHEENKLKIQNDAAKELKELELEKVKKIRLKELELESNKHIIHKQLEAKYAHDKLEFDFKFEQLRMKQSEQAHEINLINSKIKLEEIEIRKMEMTSKRN